MPRIIALSKATYRKMVQNLWGAAGYNILAIPLAAGILAPWGVTLPAAMGAVLMSLSTLVVAVNAQLRRRLSVPVVAHHAGLCVLLVDDSNHLEQTAVNDRAIIGGPLRIDVTSMGDLSFE